METLTLIQLLLNYLTNWDGGKSVSLVVILHSLTRGCSDKMCITHHTSWDGRRRVLLGSSLMLCSRLGWGMSDRRSQPPLLQPVSIAVLLRSFTAFSHSLLPWRQMHRHRGCPLPSVVSFFLAHVFLYCFFQLSFPGFSVLPPFPISSFSSSVLIPP